MKSLLQTKSYEDVLLLREKKKANIVLCVCSQHRRSHRRWGRDSLILRSFTYRADFPTGSPNGAITTDKPSVMHAFHLPPYEGRSKFNVLYDTGDWLSCSDKQELLFLNGNWSFPVAMLFHTLLSLKSSLTHMPCTLHHGP